MADKFTLEALEGSRLPPVAGARRTSVKPEERDIEIVLVLRRNPKARPLPDYAAEGFEPLDRAAFAREWGASPSDVELVMEYLKYVDARIERVEDAPDSPRLARRMVGVRGPASELARAFGTDIQFAELATGEPAILRTGALAVPAPLREIVKGVFGLDTRPIGTRGNAPSRRDLAIDPCRLPTPPQIAALYKFPQVSARGQTIALMQFGGGYLRAHTDRYFADLGVAPPTLIDVGVAGGANTPGSPYDQEVTLDIEVAGSVAREATLINYFAPHTEQGWIEAIATAVYDWRNRPTVISISWGAPELGSSNSLTWSRNGMDAMSEYFVDAACLGVTVLAAAGNHGSDCKVGDGLAHVNYPASDPRVIACSGTTIENFAGEPGREVAWTEGGGGVSDVFDVPAYQDAAELPMSLNTMRKSRGVPDIAGYADPGYAFWVGQTVVLPGTSLVAPLYAAAVALMAAKEGRPQGYLHARLYTDRAKLRDIDDPHSNLSWNGQNGAPGYFGRAGWDGRTGLGIFEPES